MVFRRMITRGFAVRHQLSTVREVVISFQLIGIEAGRIGDLEIVPTGELREWLRARAEKKGGW